MKNIVLVLLVILPTSLVGQEYFQQEVNYDIKVKLIDSIHTLAGKIEITYKSNAPEDLEEIYMHLWGNAFKTRTSAFAKQKLRAFDTEFYYAEEEEYGGYEGLDFLVDGRPVEWSFDDEHSDIAVLKLNKPLSTGGVIVISTPFQLRIPNSYSRLGHVKTSYQLTQWFPKPAVYDKNGWHPMPYLDMGEFYSEFGDFKVEITCPANYVIGATGSLKSESEIAFLEKKVRYSTSYLQDSLGNHLEYPPSSQEEKTIYYEAEDVHDFAWFADKRFLVQKEVARLASGKEVECWVYFTDFEKELWKKGAFYTKRAVEFYSERVGEYPYPQASAVQSALSAGAGMEYPMITVIGASGNAGALDQVITHEVGHNWFYGILASNERDYAWMDEGLNSYHDQKYTSIYYDDFSEVGNILPKKIKRQMEYSALAYAYHLWARIGKDQAPNTTSNDLTMINYFLGAYQKPAMAFQNLEHYLGEEKFVDAMRQYYDTWKFRHPQPEDVKASFEESTGKDLTWLFDGMLYSNSTYDYKLISVNPSDGKVVVENKGKIAAPMPLTIYKDSVDMETVWHDGFIGRKTLDVADLTGRTVEIDKDRLTLDINPGNNDLAASKPALKFLSGLKTSSKNKLFFFPMVGINAANLLQVGLVFHNYGIPLNNFQYYINPAIGTRNGELIGSFELRRDFPRRTGKLRNVSIAMGAKSFHETHNETFGYSLRFTRIQPSIDFEWKSKLVSPSSHYLTYRPMGIVTEFAKIGRETGFEGKEQVWNFLHHLSYNYVKRSPIIPLDVSANAEFRQYDRGENRNQYLKIYGEANAKFAYKRGKFFEVRGFLGFFPLHSEGDISTSAATGNFSLFHRGFNDYRFDHHFVDRRAQEGFWSRQVTMQDGGFKNGITNSMPLGLSNNYMASINLSIDLPFDWSRKFPIKPYFDAGFYSYKPFTNDPFTQEVLWSGGLMIDFQKVLMIQFPLFSAEPINNVYAQTGGNFLQRVSFTFDLNRLNPHRQKFWFWR